MWLAILRLIRITPFALNCVFLVWVLNQNPFANLIVDRTIVEAQRAIDRALAKQVTPEWLAAEMTSALEMSDLDRVQTLVLISSDFGLTIPRETQGKIDDLEALNSGIIAALSDCRVCIADVAECPSLSALTFCALPFELSPAGDLKVIAEQGIAFLSGERVDRMDLTLAVVGLGSTAAIVVTGGTSYSIKAGTTVLRIGKNIGTISPRFLRVLAEVADVGLKPDKLMYFVIGRVPFDEVVDVSRLGRLEDLSGDLTQVYQGTGSIADSVALLRHVDSVEDASSLARASEALGPRTRRSFEVLGKDKVFRSLVRLSHLAISALLAIFAAITQIVLFFIQLLVNGVLRVVSRRAARRRHTKP